MRTLSAIIVLLVAATAQAGKIETAAGAGQKGYAGDGGPAAKAQLDQPFHCDLDRQGNLYIAEAGDHCIRKIDAKTGVISTVAVDGGGEARRPGLS